MRRVFTPSPSTMFRSIRLPRRLVPLNARFHRRTFLSLSRLPMKLESRRQAGEFIDVQKVRFRSSMKAKVKYVTLIAHRKLADKTLFAENSLSPSQSPTFACKSTSLLFSIP